jgi:hypothetical protein
MIQYRFFLEIDRFSKCHAGFETWGALAHPIIEWPKLPRRGCAYGPRISGQQHTEKKTAG